MTTTRLTSRRIAAVALLQLEGSERAVDLEDLAMKMVEIAPNRFRWKKYPEQIHIERIRTNVAVLLRAKPPLATGGVRHGWMLTPAGIAWALQTPGVVPGPVLASLARSAKLLRQTEAWEKFSTDSAETITIYDARQFLRVDEYTSVRRRKERTQAVQNAAASDTDLRALVSYLRTHFPEEWT